MRRLIFSLLLCICSLPLAAAGAWPEQVVRIEEMELLTPISLSVPKMRPRGAVRAPVAMRVHVNARGAVERVALIESCGSAAHDEAALRAMRDVKFQPYEVDEHPIDVTLVVTLHLPLTKYRDSL
ncbi:energy transducer TonB [Azohydromonas australica]|uniref:energy transducer TonB n=1 Tax=Azohydromonas australica TaxID=364039 RepID=UPI000401BF71|nr:energy transducer TonB [Azohydromonas australica]